MLTFTENENDSITMERMEYIYKANYQPKSPIISPQEKYAATVHQSVQKMGFVDGPKRKTFVGIYFDTLIEKKNKDK